MERNRYLTTPLGREIYPKTINAERWSFRYCHCFHMDLFKPAMWLHHSKYKQPTYCSLPNEGGLAHKKLALEFL